jgi:protein-disulfide isomerase
MITKIGLFIASLAAALTLAFALSAAGFAPGSKQASPASATVATTTAVGVVPADALASPQVQVDTVYVAPPAAPQTITVHRVVPSSGGEGPEGND